LTVAHKELLDTLRDSRTLLLTFFLPLALYPLTILTIGLVSDANRQREATASLRVTIIGGDQAPGLAPVVAATKQVTLVPAELGPAAIRDRVVDAVLVVPDRHEAKVLSGSPSTIIVYYDQTDALSRRARSHLETALTHYRDQLLREQLDRLGGVGRLVDAAGTEVMNVASADQMGAYMLGALVPYLLVILIASAASHTAIDTTAGEKERSTLETILVSAATRGELLGGKFLATFVTAAAAGVMGLIGLTLTLSIPFSASPLSEGPILLPAWSIVVLLFMILPVAALLSALLIAFGCFARSTREGQTFASYFIMLVALVAVLSVTTEIKPTTTIYLIPILGTTQAQRQILAGSNVSAEVLLAIASTLLVAGLGLWVAHRLFANERVMFRQ
jgi:sodium transport system permease protein